MPDEPQEPLGQAQDQAPGGDGTPVSAEAAVSTEAEAGPTSPLSAAVQSLQESLRTTHDRLLRTAADFDNFKKRSRRETSESARRAEDKVVLSFLPVLDNLERALAHTEEAAGALIEGVRMVHKQFVATLERYDIRPFDSVGQAFDPEQHEAIQQAASEQPAGVVCQELQRGYQRPDRLVRPAMVIVSTGPAIGEAAETAKEADPPSEG